MRRFGKHSLISYYDQPLIKGFMNKDIVKDSKILEIFIDSNSFEKLLSEGNESAQKILKYYKSEYFEFTDST